MSIPVFDAPCLDPRLSADQKIAALAAHIARLQRQLDWALRNLEAENFSEKTRKQLSMDNGASLKA